MEVLLEMNPESRGSARGRAGWRRNRRDGHSSKGRIPARWAELLRRILTQSLYWVGDSSICKLYEANLLEAGVTPQQPS